MPSIKVSKKELQKIVAESIKKTINELDELTAYHGSKVDFNRFDLSKVKTGYGACKYGKGVYVTIDKNLAAHYATGQTGLVRTPNGIVYTVEIPDYDGTNYILWNKPIGNAVYQKIKDYWEDPYDPASQNWITPQRTGAEIFSNVGAYWSSLGQFGIDGVQVPDTTREQRVVNYIIFDDSKVKIIKKELASHDGTKINFANM